MSFLRYDGNGLTREIIGGALGISDEDLADLEPRLSAALQAIVMQHETGALGFLDSPMIDPAPIVDWARRRREDGFTDQVVIGIGGSSLGTRAILEAACDDDLAGLTTHFAENIDPRSVSRLFAKLPLETTLFVVVTKSGTTLETMGQFWIAYELVCQAVGAEKAARHFVAITDPKQGALRQLADQWGLDSFEVPPNVGGRFSVLTAVGLVPLALAGYPIDRLLDGARKARETSTQPTVATNPATRMAGEHYVLMQRGIHEVVMMAYADQLVAMVDWFRQIWAESLGKAVNRQGETVHVGLTPLKAWGVIDQHSQVQLYMEGPNTKHIMFLEVENFEQDMVVPDRPGLGSSLAHVEGRRLSEIFEAELVGTRASLQRAGRPTSRWIFSTIGPEALGGFILTWEMVTALMGELLDIDAFDQPGVELGKKIAHGLLGRSGFDEYAAMAGTNGDDEPIEVC
jgi:glucose-6-phosphate isomerase